MSLIPEFELGVWNAWILILSLFVLIAGLTPFITRVLFTRNEKLSGSGRIHNPSGLWLFTKIEINTIFEKNN